MIDPKTLQRLQNKKILILGLGAEGWSTYQFLRQHLQLQLTLADQRPLDQFTADQQAILEKDQLAKLQFGPNYLKKTTKFDLIFKAPGIPQTLPAVQKLLKKGAQLASNTQLFFELCPGKIIGVTGTKGKSTTAALIHQVLKIGGIKTLLLGNIGTPALTFLEEIQEDTLVVYELSSHQLETLTISPYIAVIQEVTSEHLDYYANTKAYQQAKTAITRGQNSGDIVIYDPQFEITAKIASLSQGRHRRHSLKEGPETVAFVRQDTLMYRQPGGQVVSVLPNNQLPLLGKHNLHNVLPAVIIGHLLNLETETIATALRQFKTLPHRLELVAERQATQYYNDSLATTPEATISALAVFDRPVVLIAGGWERDQDFTALARTILAKNVVGLVLLQSTGQRLAATLQQIVSVKTTDQPTKLPPMKFAETMAQAVHYAHQLVPSDGGVVLMSPASASFGRFKNYQDRGRQFQEAVKKLV